jgi:hypothetical protein
MNRSKACVRISLNRGAIMSLVRLDDYEFEQLMHEAIEKHIKTKRDIKFHADIYQHRTVQSIVEFVVEPDGVWMHFPAQYVNGKQYRLLKVHHSDW